VKDQHAKLSSSHCSFPISIISFILVNSISGSSAYGRASIWLMNIWRRHWAALLPLLTPFLSRRLGRREFRTTLSRYTSKGRILATSIRSKGQLTYADSKVHDWTRSFSLHRKHGIPTVAASQRTLRSWHGMQAFIFHPSLLLSRWRPKGVMHVLKWTVEQIELAFF
jgi:hypothetical protein